MIPINDQISKRVLEFALDPGGEVYLELEAPLLAPQRLDFWFRAGQWPVQDTPCLRTLIRMTRRDCSFEPYSATPPCWVIVRGCLRKQVSWFEHLCQEAGRKEVPEPPMPPQWILSPGRPETAFTELEFRPAPGWPAGFYHAAPALGMFCVVGAELPRTRETVLLRLLFNRDMRQEALAEIRALAEDDPEYELLTRIVTGVMHIIEKDPKVPQPEKESFMTAAVQEFVKFEQELIDRTTARNILKFLAGRGIDVSELTRQRILACTDGEVLDRWIARAGVVTTAEDLFAGG